MFNVNCITNSLKFPGSLQDVKNECFLAKSKVHHLATGPQDRDHIIRMDKNIVNEVTEFTYLGSKQI